MILGKLYKAIETEVDIYRIENNAFRVSCEHTQIFIGLNAAAASGNQIFYCIFNIKNPAFVLLTEKCVSLIRKLPSCISATTPPVAWLAGLGLCVFSCGGSSWQDQAELQLGCSQCIIHNSGCWKATLLNWRVIQDLCNPCMHSQLFLCLVVVAGKISKQPPFYSDTTQKKL